MNAPLLTIDNLNVAFRGESGYESVVREVNIAIPAGQSVALVGESGSGKSVTALSILRLLESVSDVQTSGKIIFDKQNILELNPTAVRKIRGNRIAMIFQEPMTSLNPVYTVGNQLMEPLLIHKQASPHEAKSQSIELLERCGIPNAAQKFDAYPHQLSGGQRQRVMIAMALASNPSLLIADEPTTALDVTIQAQILDLIADLQRDFNMAVLLITHDLNMVNTFAEQVYIMKDGRIVEEGRSSEIFQHPKHPYTIKLLQSVPKGEPTPKTDAKPILEVKDLYCHFAIEKGFFKKKTGSVKAVDGVSLNIKPGSTYGIVGESGSGKSTLGFSILRLIGSKGQLLFDGQDLNQLTGSQIRPFRKELQIVFQDPYSSLSPRLTIFQIIDEGLRIHKRHLSRQERREHIEAILQEVGLEPAMANRYPHEFSGGQRQRIAIARAVVLEPRFLVLDEPTSALDMTIQAQIIKLLRDLQEKQKMAYLFISHDLRVVKALADDIAVMKDGKIVETGPAGQIFKNPTHPYTQTLFRAAFELKSS